MVARSPCIIFLLKSLTAQNTEKGNFNEKEIFFIFSLMYLKDTATGIPQLSNHANSQLISYNS